MPQPTQLSMNMELHQDAPFSVDDYTELQRALNTHGLMDISMLHGFITAVISGPNIALDQWMDTLWNDSDPQFENEQEFQRIVRLIGRFFNTTAINLVQVPMEFQPILYATQGEDELATVAQGWCTGYLLGVTLRERPWQRFLSRDSAAQFFEPIMILYKPHDPDFAEFHDAQSQQQLVDMLGKAAVALFMAWQHHKDSAPKHPVAKKRKKRSRLR